jgi:hypothetical protein
MENEPTYSIPGPQEAVAQLSQDNRVRVLNCSAAGCLVETARPVAVDTVAILQVSFGGRVFDDLVHVTRCEAITDGGQFYYVAAKFVSVNPPYTNTLRYVIRKDTSDLAGCLIDRAQK